MNKASRASKSVADLRKSAHEDFSQGAPSARGETIRLSTRKRANMGFDSSRSLKDVSRRKNCPRHQYMRRCVENKLVPEPLIVGSLSDREEHSLNLSHYKIGDKRFLALIPSLRDMGHDVGHFLGLVKPGPAEAPKE